MMTVYLKTLMTYSSTMNTKAMSNRVNQQSVLFNRGIYLNTLNGRKRLKLQNSEVKTMSMLFVIKIILKVQDLCSSSNLLINISRKEIRINPLRKVLGSRKVKTQGQIVLALKQ